MGVQLDAVAAPACNPPSLPPASQHGAQTPQPSTGLLDLPDHLLGLVFAQLQGDARARRSLYSTCRACRESPAINELLSQRPLRIQLGEEAGGRYVSEQLAHPWPRFSIVLRLRVDCNGSSSLEAVARPFQRASEALARRLRDVQDLEVQGAAGTGRRNRCWVHGPSFKTPAAHMLTRRGLHSVFPAAPTARCSSNLALLLLLLQRR